MIFNRWTWSLLTFSWSSSSGFSLLFSWLLLTGSSLGAWGLLSGSSCGGTLLLRSLLPWLSLALWTWSSLVGLWTSSLLLLDSDFEVSANLVEEIFSESVLQHLWGFGIDGDLFSLDFRLFWDPIESSFSLLFLNLKRDSLDGSSLDSFN